MGNPNGTLGRFCSFFLCSLLAACFSSGSIGVASASAPYYLMGSLGDSITAAFMADTSLVTASRYQNIHLKMGDVTQPGSEDNDYILSGLENRWTLSWSSGNQINSHYMLINKYLNQTEPTAKIDVQNFAVTGAMAADVSAQADLLVLAAATKNIDGSQKYDSLKYVTLLIGANDACRGTNDDQLTSSLMAVFAKLNTIQQAEPIKILVSGLPRIPDVGAPDISNSTAIGGVTCHFLRNNITHTCLPLVDWTTDSQYADDMAVVIDKNDTLESAVTAAQDLYGPHLDIFYSGKLFNLHVTKNDLAAECFHPNTLAQQALSETLWADIPWFH